jgi:Regulator of chromosome condensation (RCC1) repeat
MWQRWWAMTPWMIVRIHPCVRLNFRDSSQLHIFSSLNELLSPPEQRQPLLRLEVVDHDGYQKYKWKDDDSELSFGLTRTGNISCLSAGDAHFSFIMDYRWPENETTPEMIQYYNNIWTIRTDTRSLNDDAWNPLDEELSSLETPPEISIEGPAKSKLPIFCAAKDDAVEFTECVSAGWITGGVTENKQAWIFPFGRALNKVPNLPIGLVEEVSDVVELALGDGHIVLRTKTDEVWTFGANDRGQRGLTGSENVDSWRNLDIPKGARVRQIACGRWNTFIVLERKQDPENSED